MGASKKRLRRTSDSDSESEGEESFDLDNQNLSMEEDEEDFDDDEEYYGDNADAGDSDDYHNEVGGSSGDEEIDGNGGHNVAEMEELEIEYKNLRNQELDVLHNLKRHKDEDILKGQAVKNQKALWDKSLEFRFLLQKPFSSSNRLPLEPTRSTFFNSSEEINAAYSDLISSSKKTLASLLELQEALIEKKPSIPQSSDGDSGQLGKKHRKGSKSLDVEGDEEWLQVSHMYKRIAAFRDKSIDKWQRKTQVATGAAAIKNKLQAFNQNISEQVATYMRDPSRMLKLMQLRTSMVGIFGQIAEQMDNFKEEEKNDEGNPELLDDSEFYQQLLKEFFESVDPNATETAFYALKKLQSKKRKLVDRRASKFRKIRYNVHEKIVNFMAPRPTNLPPMAPTLFEDLFGHKSQNRSSVI